MIENLLQTPPYHQWLGIVCVRADTATGDILLRLPYRPEFAGDAQHTHIHGGILATLADITATFALIAVVGHDLPSIDLHVDFLRPAPAADLLAEGRVIRYGRTISVADVVIRSAAHDKPVAVGRVKISTATPLQTTEKDT